MTSCVTNYPDPIITAMSSSKPSSPKTPTVARPDTISEAEKRQQRLAEALRANLRRRKAQKRGRAETETLKTAERGADHG
jgi:hypothetical protein